MGAAKSAPMLVAPRRIQPRKTGVERPMRSMGNAMTCMGQLLGSTDHARRGGWLCTQRNVSDVSKLRRTFPGYDGGDHVRVKPN
jgi:hypothetical protein